MNKVIKNKEDNKSKLAKNLFNYFFNLKTYIFQN